MSEVTRMTEKFNRRLEQYKSKPHRRAIKFDLRAAHIDEDERTVEVAFSSETPIRQWFGIEVLGHNADEIDLSRFLNGAAVLVNHDTDKHHGIIESARVEGTVGRAVIRFGNTDQASDTFRNIIDGIWPHISVGFFIHEMQLIIQNDDGLDEYRVTRWEPFELSSVAIPADVSVGVGRTVGIDDADCREGFSQADLDKAVRKAFKRIDDQQRADDMSNEKETDAERSAREKKEADNRAAEIKTAADSATESATEAERNRVAELLKTGEQFKASDLARKAIENGHDVHELNRQILERGGIPATKAEDPTIGLTPDETRRFSFNKLILALSDVNDRQAQEAAAFELECSRAAAKVCKKDVRGALVPFDVLVAKRSMVGRRDMIVGDPAAGGDLVATDLLSSSFIDSLENAIALVQCGVTMLPGLNGNIAIPRQTGGASHFWLAESGAPSESNATFDQVAMTPKTVGGFTEISRRLLLQSSIGAEAFTINELALRLALAIDAAGISGSGAGNEPTGILNAAGVGVVSFGTPNGGAPSWDGVVDLESAVANVNAAMGSLCYLTNTKFRGKAKKTFIDAGSGERIWDSRAGDTPLNGNRTVISNQVPSDLVEGTSGATLSAAIFGNFADLIIGMWGGLDILVNPYSLDTTGALRVTAFQDVDIALRHPESFAAAQDAITI
jgi:HK97 family phage major capsid protein